MENQEYSTNNHQVVSSDDGVDGVTSSVTRIIEGDTYPISDNESTTDSVYIIDTNTVKLQQNDDEEQGELNDSMSQDSLTNGEHDNMKNNNNKTERPSSTTTNSRMSSKMSTLKSSTNGLRSMALDEHIKLVKQKKEEAEILRLQKFQEQLRKKEQKWQQQQLERVKKWLQLRNRDTDHRSQVEERRRKRDEEAKNKIDELLRREKEREQNYQHRVTLNLRTNATHKPDSVMSMSTDVLSTRRAISASRLRSNHQDISNRRESNDSSVPPTSQDHSDTRDEASNNGTIPPTNGESHRRIPSVNRQHLHENIRRLAKPRNIAMAQSIHIGATTTSSSNGLPLSRSSHQIRVPTPPITTNHHHPTSATTSNSRRHIPSRPTTVPTLNNESQVSPTNESSNSDPHTASSSSSMKQSSHRSGIHPKIPSSSTKPPTLANSTRSKPPIQRSVMSTSYSSSSLSSSATANKQNLRHVGGLPSSKPKPKSKLTTSMHTTESQLLINDNEVENLPVNEDIKKEEESPVEFQESSPSVEPINIDIITEIINPISKREQQVIDEQDYQRKLNQKIREAQQRLELERQREEERQRQLEFEEYEREQEQIRIVEEQRQAEQERLQRAIEERERENELKRQEEQRLQQQREELERRQAEETERLNRERQERAKKEEEERNERKKRLDLIMRRTRQVSPNSKQENNTNKATVEQTNGHDQSQLSNNIFTPTTTNKPSIPHSISDNLFPSSSSTDNFIHTNDSIVSSTSAAITDTPKFKSPLIQSLLNKARNTRSTDNLAQTSMTASQIMTESMVDEAITAAQSTTPTDLSDDDDDNNTTNGHTDLHLSSSTNMNSYHDRPMEAAAAFQ